ncbi:MAG: slipin family protein [Cytophagales bacterium]
MKRITIAAFQKGLVFKNNNYKRLLNEGTHWLMPFEEIFICDITKPLVSPFHIDILLKDAAIVAATTLVEVKNNEIVLKYENGLFAGVLQAGRYVFWNGLIQYTFNRIDLSHLDIDPQIDKSVLLSKEVLPYVRSFTVDAFEKAIMFIDGKQHKILEAGTYYFWKNSTTIHVSKIDTRSLQMEISGQEILTKDKAALRVSCYVQYAVSDIIKALIDNKEYDKQLYVNMQLTLREFIGSLTLDEFLERKEQVSNAILQAATAKATDLGVTLKGCGIRDVILPGEMKEIMNQVLIAEKKAQANTIMRREETASTRSLLNTAKLMEDNAMLFKLKEMEYVEKIAEKINNITVSGNGQLIDQLKQIFVAGKT